ncbi:ABC-1 domain-containing protein [Thalassoporum mexicanum PCC 7367]|uniref:ABC1 kinase family protein n=1 Tax=Thalassoporum mexicanum TaxID=3457544 RepID=UPI00029F9376|nr:AarF/ABC1/UbiB kinase family protein [Pseudanabaena sp. PCC 7367]AFY69468.1 ABC-1 domain-containing protein [Pseudanabaena sp. PCC 7367]
MADKSKLNGSEIALDRYDAEVIGQFYRRRPLQVWARCFAIFSSLAFFFLSLWTDKKLGQADRNAKKRAIQLRKLLTRLGPAFIKIGQALSTRPDIVPPLYMDELSQLQDQLPAFDNKTAFRFIREELGADPTEVYAEITADPIAAASLGQVYKARLKTGEVVAVKVQRPDIKDGIALDMYILRGLAIWGKKNIKAIRSDLRAILDEFASRIFEEMDYVLEGQNAEKFEHLYGDLNGIYVPKIYWPYTAKRVLTMEWIDGLKLTDIEKIKQRGFDGRKIVEVGVQCSLRQLLDHGFFHADPHPGNLLVKNDGKLAYLDFGMMSQVEADRRFGLIEAIVHLVNRDFDALSKDYVRLGFLDEDTNLQPIIPALRNVFNEALGASVADLNFKNITDQLSQIMYDYPFRVPAYYALIIRSLVTLEGIALGVDPNFKVLAVAYPYVANRLLSDPNPELRDALKGVLFREGSFRWNRLENLLRNAGDNQDYDFQETIGQVTDFVLSPEGEFIRDRIADEIAIGIEEAAAKRLPIPGFDDANANQNGQGTEPKEEDMPLIGTATVSRWEHITNIWSILQNNGRIEPTEVLPMAGKILLRPETRQLGQRVVNQLAQRALARFIRELALKDEAEIVDLSNVDRQTLDAIAEQAQQSNPKIATNGNGGVKNLSSPQLINQKTPSAVGSPISRQLNGRTW